MIRNYRDHAANERTYLAWIRTGITIIALGFLVEKFDLFLALLSLQANHAAAQAIHLGQTSHRANLALVSLGILIISWATVRYFVIKRAIERALGVEFRGTVLSLFLSFVLIAFGVYLLGHLFRLL
jgi:putative membrane protein